MSEIKITAAACTDCAAVALLLKTQGLPIDDIDPALNGFFVARDGDQIVGTVGIEEYGNVGLLRSLAVRQSHQGRHLGKQLLEKALDYARVKGLAKLYLLTTTADSYFTGNGFKTIARAETPEQIRVTQQFSLICPDSAVVMEKTL